MIVMMWSNILAQDDPVKRVEAVQSMLEHFDSSTLYDVKKLVIPVVCLGLLFLALGGWRYYQTRKLRSAPLYTFHQLAMGLGVGLGQQWLLARIARREHLATPLTLLVCGATLRHHAQRYAQGASARRRSRVFAEVARIERAVFGQRGADHGPGN